MLIAARAVLGLGAAAIIPLSIAVLPVLFPEAADRNRAVGVWITASAVGLPLGPIVGGWLLDTFWWGSVFLINVPLVAVGVVAVAVLVPGSRSERTRTVDGAGVLLSSAGLLGLTYGFIVAGRDGWTDPAAWGCVAAGGVLVAAFVGWQGRAACPLVDLGLFAHPGFRAGAILSTLVNFALLGLLFALPLYFQAVGDVDAVGTGLRLLPMIGGLLAGTRIADRFGRRVAPRVVVAIGFGLLVVALGIGATTSVHTGYGLTAGWLVLLGLALGFTMPTTMAVALAALSPERSGSGSALLIALRQLGGALGVAVLGAVLSSAYQARLPLDGVAAPVVGAARAGVSSGLAAAAHASDEPLAAAVRAAYVSGMDWMLVVCAVIAAGAVVVSLLSRTSVADGPAGQRAIIRA